MAFTNNFLCDSFKQDLFAGRHKFTTAAGDTFKMSLYTNSATGMDAARTAYNVPAVTGEVSGTGYTTTGKNLVIETGMPGLTTGTSFIDFVDIVWNASTITARGALIYNDTLTTPVADASVIVLDFGSDKISSAGDFTVQFPAGVAATALIRLS